MTDYLLKFRSLVDNLIGSESQITKREIIGFVLDSLPLDYHPFSMTINTQRMLTFDNVCHLLISEEMMVRHHNIGAASAVVQSLVCGPIIML